MAITDLDEQGLVRAHQAGDEQAFGQIVRSQHRALYAHAYRRLGNHEAAEDAVQDTLLRAYRALPSFNGDLRLRAWLHRILTNVCHDEGNRRRRQVGLVDKLEAQPVELAPDPIEEAVLHDTVRVMNEALAELPESYREALVLRYVDGLSFREVAEVTGVTEENARARVHRGRLALNKVLSRLAVMAAFLVPGLRRAQAPVGEPVTTSAAAEPSFTLATQLVTHATNAAPAMSRLAELSAAMPGGKAALVGTAVAAVAAMAVPTAVVVREASRPDVRPQPVTAAPFDDDTEVTETQGSTEVTSTSLDSSAEPGGLDAIGELAEELVPSAVAPFEVTPSSQPSDGSTTTTDAPATTTTSEVPPPRPSGGVEATSIAIAGEGPNFDLSGWAVLSGQGSTGGQLEGRLSIYDDGSVVGELSVTIDGTAYPLRFRGAQTGRTDDASSTTWQFAGKFSLTGAEVLGLPPSGDVLSAQFSRDGATGGLSLLLEGPPS